MRNTPRHDAACRIADADNAINNDKLPDEMSNEGFTGGCRVRAGNKSPARLLGLGEARNRNRNRALEVAASSATYCQRCVAMHSTGLTMDDSGNAVPACGQDKRGDRAYRYEQYEQADGLPPSTVRCTSDLIDQMRKRTRNPVSTVVHRNLLHAYLAGPI